MSVDKQIEQNQDKISDNYFEQVNYEFQQSIKTLEIDENTIDEIAKRNEKDIFDTIWDAIKKPDEALKWLKINILALFADSWLEDIFGLKEQLNKKKEAVIEALKNPVKILEGILVGFAGYKILKGVVNLAKPSKLGFKTAKALFKVGKIGSKALLIGGMAYGVYALYDHFLSNPEDAKTMPQEPGAIRKWWRDKIEETGLKSELEKNGIYGEENRLIALLMGEISPKEMFDHKEDQENTDINENETKIIDGVECQRLSTLSKRIKNDLEINLKKCAQPIIENEEALKDLGILTAIMSETARDIIATTGSIAGTTLINFGKLPYVMINDFPITSLAAVLGVLALIEEDPWVPKDEENLIKWIKVKCSQVEDKFGLEFKENINKITDEEYQIFAKLILGKEELEKYIDKSIDVAEEYISELGYNMLEKAALTDIEKINIHNKDTINSYINTIEIIISESDDKEKKEKLTILLEFLKKTHKDSQKNKRLFTQEEVSKIVEYSKNAGLEIENEHKVYTWMNSNDGDKKQLFVDPSLDIDEQIELVRYLNYDDSIKSALLKVVQNQTEDFRVGLDNILFEELSDEDKKNNLKREFNDGGTIAIIGTKVVLFKIIEGSVYPFLLGPVKTFEKLMDNDFEGLSMTELTVLYTDGIIPVAIYGTAKSILKWENPFKIGKGLKYLVYPGTFIVNVTKNNFRSVIGKGISGDILLKGIFNDKKTALKYFIRHKIDWINNVRTVEELSHPEISTNRSEILDLRKAQIKLLEAYNTTRDVTRRKIVIEVKESLSEKVGKDKKYVEDLIETSRKSIPNSIEKLEELIQRREKEIFDIKSKKSKSKTATPKIKTIDAEPKLKAKIESIKKMDGDLLDIELNKTEAIAQVQKEAAIRNSGKTGAANLDPNTKIKIDEIIANSEKEFMRILDERIKMTLDLPKEFVLKHNLEIDEAIYINSGRTISKEHSPYIKKGALKRSIETGRIKYSQKLIATAKAGGKGIAIFAAFVAFGVLTSYVVNNKKENKFEGFKDSKDSQKKKPKLNEIESLNKIKEDPELLKDEVKNLMICFDSIGTPFYEFLGTISNPEYIRNKKAIGNDFASKHLTMTWDDESLVKKVKDAANLHEQALIDTMRVINANRAILREAFLTLPELQEEDSYISVGPFMAIYFDKDIEEIYLAYPTKEEFKNQAHDTMDFLEAYGDSTKHPIEVVLENINKIENDEEKVKYLEERYGKSLEEIKSELQEKLKKIFEENQLADTIKTTAAELGKSAIPIIGSSRDIWRGAKNISRENYSQGAEDLTIGIVGLGLDFLCFGTGSLQKTIVKSSIKDAPRTLKVVKTLEKIDKNGGKIFVRATGVDLGYNMYLQFLKSQNKYYALPAENWMDIPATAPMEIKLKKEEEFKSAKEFYDEAFFQLKDDCRWKNMTHEIIDIDTIKIGRCTSDETVIIKKEKDGKWNLDGELAADGGYNTFQQAVAMANLSIKTVEWLKREKFDGDGENPFHLDGDDIEYDIDYGWKDINIELGISGNRVGQDVVYLDHEKTWLKFYVEKLYIPKDWIVNLLNRTYKKLN